MSTFNDPSKALLWLDGDAFRAASGTTLPANPFAASLSGWTAFGGIKAGFQVETEQDRTPYTNWNNRSGAPDRIKKGFPIPTVKLRPTNYTVATVTTLLLGGSITETSGGSGVWEMVQGDEEFFALIIRVVDGAKQKAYYMEKGELGTLPSEVMDGDDIEGWDLEISPLAPPSGGKALRRYLSWNPLA